MILRERVSSRKSSLDWLESREKIRKICRQERNSEEGCKPPNRNYS